MAISQELQADLQAASWIMGQFKESDNLFKGRILGLILSQLYDVFMVREGFRSDDLHPPLIGRLRSAVSPHVSDSNHIAWIFIKSSLSLHLELANKRHEDDRNRKSASFREGAEHLMTYFDDEHY